GHRRASQHNEDSRLPLTNYNHNNEALYADLLGVIVPEQVVIKNLKISSNKGSKRRKSAVEEGKAQRKPRTTRKVPFKKRTCSKCEEKGHNSRECSKKGKTTEPTIEDEDKVIGEDEVDAEDEVHEVDEDYESDKDASDEDASDEHYA
nr:protein FAR1-related sequence 5-like [Tanacetum cinerariifolium]